MRTTVHYHKIRLFLFIIMYNFPIDKAFLWCYNLTNAIIGDAYVEYKMTDAFRVRVFNRSNANDFTKYNIAPFTQGVGLFYRKQFGSIPEIFQRKNKKEKE